VIKREFEKSEVTLTSVPFVEITPENREELWYLYQRGYIKSVEISRDQFEKLYPVSPDETTRGEK
jgi:hypothetical protein